MVSATPSSRRKGVVQSQRVRPYAAKVVKKRVQKTAQPVAEAPMTSDADTDNGRETGEKPRAGIKPSTLKQSTLRAALSDTTRKKSSSCPAQRTQSNTVVPRRNTGRALFHFSVHF